MLLRMESLQNFENHYDPNEIELLKNRIEKV